MEQETRPMRFDTPVIFHERTGCILQTYKTMRGAEIAFRMKWSYMPLVMLCTFEEYMETGYLTANTMVAVTNLKTGKMVGIRRSDRGTIYDPSTEQFWNTSED